MPTVRKFYKRVFQVEVLSEKPIPEEMNLDELHYQTHEGPWSGRVASGEQEELSGPQMAAALAKQHSSPGFFGLTDDGEEDGTYDPELDEHEQKAYDPVGGGGSGRSDLPYGQGGGGD